MRLCRGFSLLELLIALCIVAILLTVALPAYQSSVIKSRRSDAMAALVEVAGRQEQRRFATGDYTDDLRELGYRDNPLTTDDGHYRIAAGACADGPLATCFLLTATPLAASPQSADSRCASLTLDARGSRSATGTDPAACW
ncbi:MAG: type IV pilin protein [Chromatocurvus sp.]